jgi:cytochrome b involved in lipid metabolism
VYDVTDWISIHPGGDVILYGVGKDATAMFTGGWASRGCTPIHGKIQNWDFRI